MDEDIFTLDMDENLANNEWPENKMGRIKLKTSGNISLMAKYMTKDKYLKFNDLKTSTSGWTIAKAINTGVQNSDSTIGCHVGDKETYHLFGPEFLYCIIHDYHAQFDLYSKWHQFDMDEGNIKIDFTQSAKARIISSRIRVARNLNGFPLNTAGTLSSRLEICEVMKKVFRKLKGDYDGKFLLHTDMEEEEKQQLIKDHFLFSGRDKMQADSGYHEHFPHGRGIYLSHDKTFLIWVNEGDHLRIISMESGYNIKSVLRRLRNGVTHIEKKLRSEIQNDDDEVFLKDDVLGMITCCPSNLGSGMRASVHISLPILVRQVGLEGINYICASEEYNCQARGSLGEHSIVTDRVDISNRVRLGISEWKLVEDMIRCVNLVSDLESKLGNYFKETSV